MPAPQLICCFLVALLLVVSCTEAASQGSETSTSTITANEDGSLAVSLVPGNSTVRTTGQAKTTDDITFRIISQNKNTGVKPALIVGLHGYGHDERQMQTLVNVTPGGDYIYVSIRGLLPLAEGGYGWFSTSESGPDHTPSNGKLGASVDRIAAALPVLVQELDTDPDKTFILGYSQGAAISLSLAQRHADLGAGFIAFAGALPPVTYASASKPPHSRARILIGYGTKDPIVRTKDIDRTVAELLGAGHKVELQTFNVPHVVSSTGRRAVASWIDDRLSGVPMPNEAPSPLSLFVDTQTAEETAQPNRTEAAFAAAVARGAVHGNPNGDVTIYKFFDYNCPVCKAAHRRMDSFLDQHPNVRVVAVDVPVLGQNSEQASAVTFELSNPEIYKKVYTALMQGRGRIDAATALDVINSFGLEIDRSQVNALLDQHRFAMRENVSAMTALGIEGTPGFLVVLSSGDQRSFTGWRPEEMARYFEYS
ncbi:MAG: DsbA family protein [Pseudomonadota bacterium]